MMMVFFGVVRGIFYFIFYPPQEEKERNRSYRQLANLNEIPFSLSCALLSLLPLIHNYPEGENIVWVFTTFNNTNYTNRIFNALFPSSSKVFIKRAFLQNYTQKCLLHHKSSQFFFSSSFLMSQLLNELAVGYFQEFVKL